MHRCRRWVWAEQPMMLGCDDCDADGGPRSLSDGDRRWNHHSFFRSLVSLMERVRPESSSENHRRYRRGPMVRIQLPPEGSPLRNDAGEI